MDGSSRTVAAFAGWGHGATATDGRYTTTHITPNTIARNNQWLLSPQIWNQNLAQLPPVLG